MSLGLCLGVRGLWPKLCSEALDLKLGVQLPKVQKRSGGCSKYAYSLY